MTVALCSAFNPQLFGSSASESEESIYVDVFFLYVSSSYSFYFCTFGLSENRHPILHLTPVWVLLGIDPNPSNSMLTVSNKCSP